MALVNSFDGSGLWVAGERRVLSPEEFGALQTAQHMLTQCRDHCDAQEAQGAARIHQQERLGYQQGLERAAREGAQRLLEFERSRALALAAQQSELADLVMVVLERIAPALGPGELIRVLARQAVEHARHASRALLKVHPACVDDVELELEDMRRSCAWLDSIEVVGVEGMQPDECLLESPHGFVNASWQTQLGAIRSLMDGLGGDTPAAIGEDSVDHSATPPAQSPHVWATTRS
jgi:type III secretion protein L